MNRYHSATKEEDAEINLTPMLDVVFIMLIFFVVTASFIKDFGIPVALPAGLPVLTEELETITVTVEPGHTFNVNGRPLAKGSLVPYLRYLTAGFPDARFAVLVHDDAFVEDTVAAADAGRQVGYRRIPISYLE